MDEPMRKYPMPGEFWSIFQVLVRAIAAREISSGKRATALYVGTIQWEALMAWSKRNLGHESQSRERASDEEVPEFYGCKVYRVHVADHICAV